MNFIRTTEVPAGYEYPLKPRPRWVLLLRRLWCVLVGHQEIGWQEEDLVTGDKDGGAYCARCAKELA